MRNKNILNFFVDRVRGFASAHDLFVIGGRYIVALSGGADSVSLLLAMKSLADEYGMTIDAAHCNFHLRGDESERDERFCVELCSRLGIELHRVHFDTNEYAELHHVSIEMAARDLRYSYFERLRTDIGATDICVAHHRDDSVETVLLNLVRGTGLRGLRGIQPRNGHIVRPLLCLSRKDILQFIKASGESYVVDSTNLHNDVKRNKIRLDIMPMLQRLNPSVANSIFETSLRVGEALKVYDHAIEESMIKVVSPMEALDKEDASMLNVPIQIDTKRLLCQPSPESILFHLLSKRGFSTSQVEHVSAVIGNKENGTGHGSSGKTMQSTTHELLFDRGCIIVQPCGWGICNHVMRMPEIGTYIYSEDKKITISEDHIGNDYELSRDNWCVCVDASEAKFPLTLRTLRDGERFMPLGMKHTKLVSDFLTDIKLTLFDKRRQLVLVDAHDRIVWLVGRRIDNRFRVVENSKRALRIKMQQQK